MQITLVIQMTIINERKDKLIQCKFSQHKKINNIVLTEKVLGIWGLALVWYCGEVVVEGGVVL